ncbi:hypothetical protein BN961_02177 [Afipia felis]|uniref:DUF551 domain-containing protein n=1 Tax=Afipia felis TaxID=1035 RepID=A0A090MT26_AFIFE|nr:hypothetical protein [Afipia felis]CEG08759.1 hypothetical protein BN961_02177 [Afipia felis]
MTRPDEIAALADRLELHTKELANQPLCMTMSDWSQLSNDMLAAAQALRLSATSPGDAVWRPITTAPRDGTWFLARATEKGWGATRVVRFSEPGDRLPIHGEGKMWPSPPTHWMPLPNPPVNAALAPVEKAGSANVSQPIHNLVLRAECETQHAGVELLDTKNKIIALIREGFDPEPNDWPRHRGWDDGAGEIAEKIIAVFQHSGGETTQTVETCPRCNLKADSLLHKFCTHSQCPIRSSLIQSAAHGGGTKFQSQAKATEGKAGMAGVSIGPVRRSTAGTGLQVGESGADLTATSEHMDVTAGETAPSPSDPAQEPEEVGPLREARPSIPEDGFNCIWLMENGHQVGCLDGAQNEPAVIARAQHWSRPVSLDREAIIHIINEKVEIGGISAYWERPYLEGVEDVADAILALIEGRT